MGRTYIIRLIATIYFVAAVISVDFLLYRIKYVKLSAVGCHTQRNKGYFGINNVIPQLQTVRLIVHPSLVTRVTKSVV